MPKKEKPSVSSNSAYIRPHSRTRPVDEVLEKKGTAKTSGVGKEKQKMSSKFHFETLGLLREHQTRLQKSLSTALPMGRFDSLSANCTMDSVGLAGAEESMKHRSLLSTYLSINYLILSSIRHPST